MGKRKKWPLWLIVGIACIVPAGIVLGSWTADKSTDNFLTMGSYRASLLETYEVPDHVDPSQQIEKVVQVKNDGTVDILVRVRVEKAFGMRKNGKLIPDKTLNTDVIEIDFADTYWEAREDGWFYYKDILRAGETTKEPLMKSFRLSEKAGNEYKGKDAQIVVSMESVQAYEGASSVWGVTEKDLGIRMKSTYETKETGVTFLGSTEGFSVQGDNTDLFAAFKNLVPGCGRTQEIQVKNQSSEAVEILLRAEETKQGSMTKKQKKLVKQLLEEYAVIRVEENGEVLYEGPVCGKDTDGTMQKDISLGEFAAGESRKLTATVSLSPQMDNRYQNLTGKVRWVFSAQGEDGKVVRGVAPVTGDPTAAGMWAALLFVSGASLAGAFWAAKRNRRKEQNAIPETND